MLAACAKWGLSFFLVSLGSSLFGLSFYSFSFFFFMDDGLILDGNTQKAVKFKTTNLTAIHGNYSKITKFGTILEYFLALTLFCGETKR